MCGIFGYVTNKEEALGPILIAAAERLTYRGYDSVGAATMNNGKIDLRKDVARWNGRGEIQHRRDARAARHHAVALGNVWRAFADQLAAAYGFEWRHGRRAQWQCGEQCGAARAVHRGGHDRPFAK